MGNQRLTTYETKPSLDDPWFIDHKPGRYAHNGVGWAEDLGISCGCSKCFKATGRFRTKLQGSWSLKVRVFSWVRKALAWLKRRN